MKKSRENDTYITSAEYQVLSLIIKNPDMDIPLRKADFPHEKAQRIFQSILILRETEEEINYGSLLREANKLDSSIDPSYISSLINFTSTDTNFTRAVEVLEQTSIKHKARLIVDTLSARIDSFDDLRPDQLNEYLSRVQELIRTGRKTILKTAEEVFENYIEELRQRQRGIVYPFNDYFLDMNLTRKAAPGQVVLCAGTTGTGKSIYGLNIVNGCLNLDTPSLYASMEMDELSTAERLASLRTGIPIDEWYKRDMIPSLIERVEDEIKKVKEKKFSFTDDPSLNLEKIRRLVREFKKKYGVNYLILFLDLVTQIKEFLAISKGNSLATAMEIAVNRLNELAKQENICIFAIAQMGRNPHKVRPRSLSEEDLDQLRPTLEQIKNSNALAERSRVVISLFRAKYLAQQFFPGDEELEFMEDRLDADILKQSMGRTGDRGSYIFDGTTSRLFPAPVEVRRPEEE